MQIINFHIKLFFILKVLEHFMIYWINSHTLCDLLLHKSNSIYIFLQNLSLYRGIDYCDTLCCQ